MSKAGTPIRRLPHLDLTGPSEPVRLRAPELGSPVLLLVRDAAFDRARPYITALGERVNDLRDWNGRPMLITEQDVGDDTVAPAGDMALSTAGDDAGRTGADSGLPTAVASPETWDDLAIEDSALVIADRWGVVYFVKETTTFADLPPVEEVVEWTRFLATQCPECGVIDEPGYGEWSM